jgi:hypothetical protein
MSQPDTPLFFIQHGQEFLERFHRLRGDILKVNKNVLWVHKKFRESVLYLLIIFHRTAGATSISFDQVIGDSLTTAGTGNR